MSEPTDSPLPETERPPITRRQLVGASGFAAVGLALSACGEGSGEEGPEEDPLQAASAAVIAPSGWINVRDFGALGNGDGEAAGAVGMDRLSVDRNQFARDLAEIDPHVAGGTGIDDAKPDAAILFSPDNFRVFQRPVIGEGAMLAARPEANMNTAGGRR